MRGKLLSSSLLATLLAALVVAQLVAQWQWLREIEYADHSRLSRTTGYSAWLFKEAFDDELATLAKCLEVPGGQRSELAAQLQQRLRAWGLRSRWPELLDETYLFVPPVQGEICLQALGSPLVGDGPPVERLGRARATFEPARLPAPLVTRLQSGAGPPVEKRRDGIRGDRAILATPPTLIAATRVSADGEDRHACLLLTLDRRQLVEAVIPDLVALFFPPPSFDAVELAIVANDSDEVLFATPPIETAERFGRVDTAYGLVDAGDDGPEAGRAMGRRAPGNDAIPSSARPPTDKEHRWVRDLFSRLFFSGHWRLLVRRGSRPVVEQAAAMGLRRKLTAGSIGLLLSASLVVIVVLARRSQRLAQQQLRFVAGVSHELRTPLAVLSAAGDNLSDALVTDRKQLERYGRVIQSETGRLQEMVENVLHLARQGSGSPPLELTPLDVAELVDGSLRRAHRHLEDAGFEVEREVAPGSLSVLGNARALQSVLLNLISNAVKYGRAARWLRVSAAPQERDGVGEVRIEVEDRGPGVDRHDLPHLFDAFYRGGRAVDQQIEGSGLGLTVVADLVRAHRGRVSVARSPQGGTIFAIHLQRVAPR